MWTLVEKQKFIDSLINQFPVPLFLGVAFEHSSRGSCFEILDGMQRLEAITSFIEGEFPVEGGYFDLSTIAETNKLLNDGKLVQKSPILDFHTCTNLLNYPLPISTSAFTTTENVDETFRRINTGGIRLSTHEVRQAGAISDFPQLVRKCAIYIRGDVSHTDIVDLDAMRSISLTSDDLNYGIKVKETFWYRTHILTSENILASRDEEVVAHILLHILLKKDARTSTSFLDEIYTPDSESSKLVDDTIIKHGADIIYKQFCFVFDELTKVIQEFGGNLAAYLYDKNPQKIQHAYQVLYLSFFDLLMNQNKKIQNIKSLSLSLRGIATNSMGKLSNDRKWIQAERIQMINSVKGVLSPHFIPREGMDPTAMSWVDNLQNILNQSRTENVCYDFKIGLHDLTTQGEYNPNALLKIIKTLTAMSNSHTGDSYVIIGIADSKEHAERHNKIYASEAIKYGDFYVAGVGNEACKFYKNIDAYQQFIQQMIDAAPISDEVKRAIQRNVVFIKYYDKDVILLKITRGKTPLKFDGKIYVRKMANTDPQPISEDNEFAFFGEFMEQSNRYPYTI
ncbi:TPA: DUF262 domain-containing protein [Aeromonas hydrophila]|nr:DUF262 domain-containing protein [Aeromonas hydrophila]